MPLSPEQEWTLVACGLIAHADGILEVGEWDQVLELLDERLEGDEANTWLDELADKGALEGRLAGLVPPAPLFSESILEKAWRMALADGAGSEVEAAVHDTVAERLGVPKGEVAGLRNQWLLQARRRAEIVAGFAVIMAGRDGRLDPAELAEYESLLERLPLTDDRREAMRALPDNPPQLDDLVGRLLAMDTDERGIALRALVPLVHAAARGEQERALFLDVAERLALSRDDAAAMLDR